MLDLDGDGEVSPFTDGVVMLRWFFGIRGESLVNGVVGPGCTLCTPTQVEAAVAGLEPQLDIDLDGRKQPLTDGLLILRYLVDGGEFMTQGAVGDECGRCDAPSIADYIESLL